MANIDLAGVTRFGHGPLMLTVPAATPRAIVERLHAEIARIAATPEARDWFAASGAEPGIVAPAEMDEFVRREHAHFGRVIREAGLRID